MNRSNVLHASGAEGVMLLWAIFVLILGAIVIGGQLERLARRLGVLD